jgi:NADPH-dependent curcumin reductase CurA
VSRAWFLARAPQGRLRADDFELRDVDLPPVAENEVRCELLWLSIDAANRAWMQGATYRSAVTAGTPMPGLGLGRVVESRSPSHPVGTIVAGDLGWREQCVVEADDLEVVRGTRPLPEHLGVLGVSGLTAYFGLLRIGDPQPGETVVVSAAAGATGSLVGQMARIRGCRVVGLCGSPAKQRWLEDRLGYDVALDHRSDTLAADLKAACPDGVDVYFDNVGGPVLEGVLPRMRVGGRIVCCGVISQYDTDSPRPGPAGVPGLIVTRRLTMRGFIYTDFQAEFDAAQTEIAGWLDDGSLQVAQHVAEGLDRAPDALVDLLAGATRGKCLVRIAPETVVAHAG